MNFCPLVSDYDFKWGEDIVSTYGIATCDSEPKFERVLDLLFGCGSGLNLGVGKVVAS